MADPIRFQTQITRPIKSQMTCDDWHECVRFLFKSISTLSIHADGFLCSIRATQRISKLIIVRKQILMEQTNADHFSHEEWTQKPGFSSRSCWLSRSETQITVFVPQTIILALFSLNDVLRGRLVTLTAIFVDRFDLCLNAQSIIEIVLVDFIMGIHTVGVMLIISTPTQWIYISNTL